MWSAVATVRSGTSTGRPRSRSMAKAWGDVASWTRWSRTKSWWCPEGSTRTVWASNTLS